MEKQRIVNNLVSFGELFSRVLKNRDEGKEGATELEKNGQDLIDRVSSFNPWFTTDFVLNALNAWSASLKKEKVIQWLDAYDLEGRNTPKKVGLILAGNIPMVGLHDILSVLVSGNELHVKLSSKDSQLISWCLEILSSLDEEWSKRIIRTEKLNHIDLLIATGNDNSARYFEYYFRNVPKIIRKNRTSVAVLTDQVNEGQLNGLANDVFTYFGLGCRNVTKVYVPQDFDLDRIFSSFYKYKELINHHQYANNYDYNKAVYLMNKIELRENGFILLKEDDGLHSPLGVLFYERYDEPEEVFKGLQEKEEDIQAIVSDLDGYLDLGKAQSPELWEYADNVDTVEFLITN